MGVEMSTKVLYKSKNQNNTKQTNMHKTKIEMWIESCAVHPLVTVIISITIIIIILIIITVIIIIIILLLLLLIIIIIILPLISIIKSFE